jgi:hydrogenase maturation protein HypF
VLQAYEAGIEQLRAAVRVVPEVVATTSTPTISSTRYALAREGVETVAVQHHHAHLARAGRAWRDAVA